MSVDPRFTEALLDDEAVVGGRVLTSLAGRPDALVVLGSGLAEALDEAWGAPVATVALGDIPGVVAPVADGHGGELRAYETRRGVVLVATGRTHLYEGLGPRPVTALARAPWAPTTPRGRASTWRAPPTWPRGSWSVSSACSDRLSRAFAPTVGQHSQVLGPFSTVVRGMRYAAFLGLFPSVVLIMADW